MIHVLRTPTPVPKIVRQDTPTPAMPLGFERLNERVKRPNEFINFIRPLPGADETKSKDFLGRVAAIVSPIMKTNHLAVMALEEFPPNREFWGRNFNNGEVIQLVLKSIDGRWLPLRHVQMVMIHELAHVKEMNHSRFFWRVRNAYADELHGLWAKGYTGEGFWGAGRGLDDSYLTNQMPDSTMIPSSLCGGTYKRRRKRKKTAAPADAEGRKALRVEQKQKRILKKFGAGGTALGADEGERLKLEGGKNFTVKPRVAASARSRELRAAAALARFEKAKVEDVVKTEDHDSDATDSDATVSDWTEDLELHDKDRKMLDAEGKDLVRVCDGEINGDDSRRERDELLAVDAWRADKDPESTPPVADVDFAEANVSIHQATYPDAAQCESSKDEASHIGPTIAQEPSAIHAATGRICPVCSCENLGGAVVCVACSNVLDPNAMPNHWKCQTSICRDGAYLNIGDYGRCQVCGSRRPEEHG
jgi:DNA-dependent metalloprotease WSS1